MLKFVKRYSLIALMAIFAFSFIPSMTSASTLLKQDVEAKILGELNVLNVVKFGGQCDKIYVKVNTKQLNGIDLSKLKLSIKYDIYHSVNQDALKGKIVGTGEVTTKQNGDYYEIVYDPTANPNGPAGNYAFKIYLGVGKGKNKHGVVVRVKINEPCKGSNNGGTNNGGTNAGDNGGTNAGNNGGTNAGNNGGANAGNNGGANAGDNGGANAGNNGGAANAGANAGKTPGGKLPKTANNFAGSMTAGVVLALAGVAVLAYRRREISE